MQRKKSCQIEIQLGLFSCPAGLHTVSLKLQLNPEDLWNTDNLPSDIICVIQTSFKCQLRGVVALTVVISCEADSLQYVHP